MSVQIKYFDSQHTLLKMETLSGSETIEISNVGNDPDPFPLPVQPVLSGHFGPPDWSSLRAGEFYNWPSLWYSHGNVVGVSLTRESGAAGNLMYLMYHQYDGRDQTSQGVVIKPKCLFACLRKEALRNSFDCVGIHRPVNRNLMFRLKGRYDVNGRLAWIPAGGNFEPPGGLDGNELGDVCSLAHDGSLWGKVDAFSTKFAQVIDHRRDWYHHGLKTRHEITDIDPLGPGARHEVYGMSVLSPRTLLPDVVFDHKYVALVSVLTVPHPIVPAQPGPIDLYWATSPDGVEWSYPFASSNGIVRPAISRPTGVGMIVGSASPFVVGTELRFSMGVHCYLHNRRQDEDKSGATLLRVDIEELRDAL